LIITGYGGNCEAESRAAWELAGAAPQLVHLNDLLADPDSLRRFRAMMFIGGFSYGDHLGSGHVLALRIRHRLSLDLQAFIEAGRLVLGVCNGFQVMVKLGLLPGLDDDYFRPRVALIQNDNGLFQNFWVRLRFEAACPCVFTQGLDGMDLPIRHGEGKLFTPDPLVLDELEQAHCVACRYVDPATGVPTLKFPHNPNGSLNAIAGLCDPSGRLFGLMPHPEAYLFPENHPHWLRQQRAGTLPPEGLGLALFRRAVAYLNRA